MDHSDEENKLLTAPFHLYRIDCNNVEDRMIIDMDRIRKRPETIYDMLETSITGWRGDTPNERIYTARSGERNPRYYNEITRRENLASFYERRKYSGSIPSTTKQ
jgi:hypothetical protein